MFRRRQPQTRRRKIRQAIWPSMGMRRLFRYYKHRIARLNGTPAQIAGGFAAGIAVSFTPFLGLHLLMGLVICLACRFSKIAMVIGTIIAGNPWTIPLISLGSYELGHLMLGHMHPSGVEGVSVKGGFGLRDLFLHPLDLLLPMTVGSVPLMVVVGTLSFFAVRSFVRAARAPKGGRA